MEPTQQQELERFFAEVAPRLDTAQTLDDELDRQLARRFNVFRYLRTDEMGFSKMIKDLLDPAGDHGQGAAFLRLLTEKLDFAKGLNLDHARVQTERQIDEGRLDITVEIDSSHCLAIENKSNFAHDQESQVESYLRWLKRQYGRSLLIYLSPTGYGPSEASVNAKAVRRLATETPKRFVIMPCDASNALEDGFDSLRLPFSLVDWLADCRRNCDVDRLRWYLRETETYCRQNYGGHTVTDSKKNAIEEFLRGNKKNLATALAVYETYQELAPKIKREFMDLIWCSLPEDMVGGWDYFEGGGSYICIRRKSWREYDAESRLTWLNLEDQDKAGAKWKIGVWSPRPSSVSKGDRERRDRLQEKLGQLGKKQSHLWPCWEWIDAKYQNWNSIIPELDEEVAAGGGEITDYFVHKFKEIADQAIPIIDSIDGAR